jgi:outer membrane protein TolC
MQLQISQLAIAQTQDNLRIYNDRYLSGTITLSNLLEIQTLLQQNQDAYLDAYITFTKKRTYYLQITGQ